MNKILIFILLTFSILCIKSCSGQQLSPEENAMAIKLYDNQQYPGLPCSINSIFTCQNRGSYFTVIGIILESGYQTNQVDFSIFKNLTSLSFGKAYSVIEDFWTIQIQLLTNLQSFSIYYIGENNQIPKNTIFPERISMLTISSFFGTFYSHFFTTNLSSLIIKSSSNITYDSLPNNFPLSYLQTPFPPNGFPSDLSTAFPLLGKLDLIMYQMNSTQDVYPSSVFGTFNFPSLMILSFSTGGSITKKFELPDFSKCKSLSILSISDDIFILQNDQVLDFTAVSSNFKISISNSSLFGSCETIVCLKLPSGSNIQLIDSYFKNINLLDFTNSTSVIMNGCSSDENYPMTFDNFDFNKLGILSIQSSSLVGDLPNDLCKVPIEYLRIQNNNFAGTVPDCFLCTYDVNIRNYILPNKFPDFDQETSISCNNFEINTTQTDYSVDTLGASIVIYGETLGFDLDSSPSFVDVYWEKQNEAFIIQIPQASIDNINNTQVNVSLVDGSKKFSITYRYNPPTLKGYQIIEENEDLFFILVGENLDYSGKNSIYLNGSLFSGTADPNTKTLLNILNSNYEDALSSLKEGYYFTVQVNSFVKNTTKETYFFSLLYVRIDQGIDGYTIPNLNSTGGKATLTGFFPITILSSTKIIINGNYTAKVLEITNSTLVFVYPTLPVGEYYPFELILAGSYYSDSVNVVYSNTTSSTDSTSDGTSSTDSTSDDTSSTSDDISSSKKLIIKTSLIVKFLTNSNLNFPNDYCFNNNEIINYSLVSSSWFKIIENLLCQILKFKNYNVLSPLIKNSKFSLIKLENSVIVYNSLEEYQDFKYKNINYKKILIDIKDYEHSSDSKTSIDLLLSNQEFPENLQFNINLSIYPTDLFYRFDFSRFLIFKKNINKLYLRGHLNTNQENSKTFEKINQLKPKQIEYLPHEPLRFETGMQSSIDISKLFENSNLRHLKVSYDYTEISDLKIPSNSSLKSFISPIRYHEILRILNNTPLPFSKLRSIDSIPNDWEQFIKTLSNNNSLKKLTLDCNLFIKFYEITQKEKNQLNFSLLTNGIKSILSSSIVSIEFLEIKEFDFIKCDGNIIEGLCQNKSIKTLLISFMDNSIIIEKVLTINHNIKNLIIESINIGTNILELLSNLSIYLYSLSFYILSNNDVVFLLNFIINNQNNLNLKIKEINFFIHEPLISFFKYQYLLNNNLIVNIIEIHSK